MTYKFFDTVLTFLYFLKYNYLLDSDAIMLFEMVRRLLFARISQATRIEIVNKKIIRNLYRETKCREISMLNCAFKSKFLRSFQKFNVISKKFCIMLVVWWSIDDKWMCSTNVPHAVSITNEWCFIMRTKSTQSTFQFLFTFSNFSDFAWCC